MQLHFSFTVTCVTLCRFENCKFLNFSKNAGKALVISEL